MSQETTVYLSAVQRLRNPPYLRQVLQRWVRAVQRNRITDRCGHCSDLQAETLRSVDQFGWQWWSFSFIDTMPRDSSAIGRFRPGNY